ncbi:DUF3263 domain-containing protein [Nonomuraea glycinis]|jgi:hypothetical protein|uniref:DUF3263 domain-containing protein n=1 Tax=Nonomuraea glycinis TaxID=2047744 RepID=A0A918AET4_9ACTN|nr:DUF3263 domain-containing protein [Nonomuraea glycinis]MCA2182675.1 DUF3263 domain-containing protein [Nonomuraea glycinis]WSG69486.1 DUF3263 domain-containing protein [Nonomuraea glycinis]GGP16744.1 hypothetical protein GCM10012278_81730 [Nonomuraea glycinis]
MDTAPAGGDSAAPGPDRQPLTDRELELLAFERHWWRYAGAKEQAIKETFGFSTTRYYQLLGELIDRPEALEQDPMLVKRLRRLRAGRQRERAARRFGMRP